ncbi:hypothetical protein FR932_13100 [Moritella marina ATCC 15381]|uniref:Nucleoside transporter/FeoB GTPase Gate domain-containing protein n=1 Tax=Moritella marina ATCC 15381 TaxID=1202962 RepID=A0A5J6WP65_MORMI|nr:nucleoside recognition domain-containing protein [Moritella marina]QFI38720.1 hypothetical protein FR932_13100 [Moritella marina ATCC 15381]
MFTTLKSLFLDVWRVYLTLLKVMVPALIIVKILDMIGGTQWLAKLLAPLMSQVGLPEEMGLVWATAMLTNIYTGMAVYFDLAGDSPLTVAQVSVLGIMMLLAHALPVEGAVAKLSGVSWRVTLPLRIGGGFILGMIANQVYQLGNWQQQPAVIVWQPTPASSSLFDWTMAQLSMLFSIFFIIAALMILLRLLKWCGIEKLMQTLLSPFLKALTIGKETTNVCVIGLVLGLSFGAGLLIDEARTGRISKRDIFLAVCFLGLTHSIIEDTILILLLGADLIAILWGRLLFSFVVIAILARCIKQDSHAIHQSEQPPKALS